MKKTTKNNFESPLEFIINKILNPAHNMSEASINDAQLILISQNWPEAKKYITNMIFEDEASIFDIGRLLEKLGKKTGVFFEESEVKVIYNGMIKKGKLDNVAWLSQYTKLKPAEEQLNEIWKKFFYGEWNKYELEEMQKHFGKPKLSQDDFDRQCNEYLEIWAGKKNEKWSQLIQPEDVQAFVSSVGKKPNWNKETAKQAYDKWLSYHFHEKLLLFLQGIGIKPEAEKVQGYYTKMLSNECRHLDSMVEELERVIRVTGILPEADKIKRVYENHLDHTTAKEIKKIEELTGIKCDEEIVNRAYFKMLKEGDIIGINLLRNETKIQPSIPQKGIQPIYTNLLEKGQIKAAINVYLFTEVDPEAKDETVAKACNNLINNKQPLDYEGLEWLFAKFPQATTPILQDHISKLVKEEMFPTIDYLLSRVKLQPRPVDKYVLACQGGDWKTAKKLYKEHGEAIKKEYPSYATLITILPKSEKE